MASDERAIVAGREMRRVLKDLAAGIPFSIETVSAADAYVRRIALEGLGDSPDMSKGYPKETLDAGRLRYIAEQPEVLRYLYDIFTNPAPGVDRLAQMRATLDQQMEQWPNGTA